MVVKPGQLSNRLPGILVIPVSNSTLCSATHPRNGPPEDQEDAVSRLLGIRILVKLVQSEKAHSPNFVKLFDNCTVDSFSQSLNAQPPISVTVSGIVMVVKPGQLSNRLPGILVIPVSNSTLCSATHPRNGPPEDQEDAVSRLLGIRILVKLVQSEKAHSPNFVKLFDNCTVDSFSQSLNAQPPISVTVSGIVTFIRQVPSKALFPIATTLCPSIVCGMASADTLPL